MSRTPTTPAVFTLMVKRYRLVPEPLVYVASN
jgi:hypothetical protein